MNVTNVLLADKDKSVEVLNRSGNLLLLNVILFNRDVQRPITLTPSNNNPYTLNYFNILK